MAPKGGNAKKEGGRAKKAENEVRYTLHLKGPLPLLSDSDLLSSRTEEEGNTND